MHPVLSASLWLRVIVQAHVVVVNCTWQSIVSSVTHVLVYVKVY